MSMSVRDYEMIAERIRESSDMEELVCQLAATFLEGNSRFNKRLFFAATGRDIVDDYEVDKHGIITSPGKFEGEMYWMPAAVRAHLNGSSVGVVVDKYGETHWTTYIKWGGSDRQVIFFESENGYIYEVNDD